MRHITPAASYMGGSGVARAASAAVRLHGLPAPVTVRRPDPQAWRHALRLAGGDHRRLELLADGTVLVHNRQAR